MSMAAAPTEPRAAAPAVTTADGVEETVMVALAVPLLGGVVVTTGTVLMDGQVAETSGAEEDAVLDSTTVIDVVATEEADAEPDETMVIDVVPAAPEEPLLLLPPVTLAQNCLVAGRTWPGGLLACSVFRAG